MTRAYAVDHAASKLSRVHALAIPLTTTEIAAHKASWLNRGSAIVRSSDEISSSARIPPTQSDRPAT